MADLGSCPHCSSLKIGLARSFAYHVVRMAFSTHRRYCRDCGLKWIADERAGWPTLRILVVLIAAISLGRLGFFVSRVATRSAAFRQAQLDHAAKKELAKLSPDGLTHVETAETASVAEPPMGAVKLFFKAWQAEVREPSAQPSQGQAAAEKRRLYDPETAPADSRSDLASLIKSLIKKTDQGQLNEIDNMSKKDLWDKYGSHFSSKEEAKQAYEEYKKQRASGDATPSK